MPVQRILATEVNRFSTKKREEKSFESYRKFYDKYWLARTTLCIDEKCRKNFVVLNVKKIKSKFGHRIRIIDLGCGRGWLTEVLSKYGDVLGVDLSTKTAKRMYPHIKFETKNIILDKIQGNYDIVVSCEVIEHLIPEHQQTYIKKAYELLDENGYIILTTPNKINVEKLSKKLQGKLDQMQPIENWLDKDQVMFILRKFFEIEFAGSIMFYPISFRINRILNKLYQFFYDRLNGYKIIDRILNSTNHGLYLAIVGRKKQQNLA